LKSEETEFKHFQPKIFVELRYWRGKKSHKTFNYGVSEDKWESWMRKSLLWNEILLLSLIKRNIEQEINFLKVLFQELYQMYIHPVLLKDFAEAKPESWLESLRA